jgi:hypothetical protein
MTSQVLMSSGVILSEVAPSAANHKETSANPQAAESAAPPRKLPYQANHQVELLHLQAETEALLQHLKTLKQQRLADLPQVEIETVLAPR